MSAMSSLPASLPNWRVALRRLLEELLHRQRPAAGGWSYCGKQVCTEPTSLALLALVSAPPDHLLGSVGVEPLLAIRQPDGTWPSTAGGSIFSLWATALAVNAMVTLQISRVNLAPSLDALVHSTPKEASWLVRLKFRYSDRQVRFDPQRYGWGWVPETVSWVVPTSMAIIALERARKRGLIGGRVLESRLQLGVEMLLDRACPGGGWNAGNPVVYGVPLRPHVDATAITLAALRSHYQHPRVGVSLDWLLGQTRCRSSYSLAWLALALDVYTDVRADVPAALNAAQEHLAARIDDPGNVDDTSTIALAALALGLEAGNNPFALGG